MEFLKKLLSELLYNILSKLNFNKLFEIRMRNGQPITVNYNNNYYFVGENGLTDAEKEALISEKEDIEQIIMNASNSSIYAINDQLKQGFVTSQGGIRIGLVGQVIEDGSKILTVKNFHAINIRIPHQVTGCSLNILPYLFKDNQFINTLLISPPGAGKTTMLRDICYQISQHNLTLNILLIDERNEIASCNNGKCELDVGKFTDVITGGTKKVGFINGIRSMSPDIICTDELGVEEDFMAIEQAYCCGVGILASVHASSVFELKEKPLFKDALKKNIFKRFIVLSNKKGKGTIDGVFDETFRLLYSRVS